MTTLGRHYRAPTAARIFLRGFLLFAALVGIGIVLDYRGGIPAVLIAVLYYGFLLLIWLWGERTMSRAGLYESPVSLTIVHSLGRSETRWELISRFEQAKAVPRSRVLIVKTSGAVVPIVGTAQGSRITWDGGETRDIVSVLNERLSLWRSQQAQPVR